MPSTWLFAKGMVWSEQFWGWATLPLACLFLLQCLCISGLLSFLLNPNPNPKQNSKSRLLWGWGVQHRSAAGSLPSVVHLDLWQLWQGCLFCYCCSTVLLWPFSEKREGDMSLLYLHHSVAGVGFFLPDLVEMRLAREPGSSSSFVAAFFFFLLLFIKRGYHLW